MLTKKTFEAIAAGRRQDVAEQREHVTSEEIPRTLTHEGLLLLQQALQDIPPRPLSLEEPVSAASLPELPSEPQLRDDETILPREDSSAEEPTPSASELPPQAPGNPSSGQIAQEADACRESATESLLASSAQTPDTPCAGTAGQEAEDCRKSAAAESFLADSSPNVDIMYERIDHSSDFWQKCQKAPDVQAPFDDVLQGKPLPAECLKSDEIRMLIDNARKNNLKINVVDESEVSPNALRRWCKKREHLHVELVDPKAPPLRRKFHYREVIDGMLACSFLLDDKVVLDTLNALCSELDLKEFSEAMSYLTLRLNMVRMSCCVVGIISASKQDNIFSSSNLPYFELLENLEKQMQPYFKLLHQEDRPRGRPKKQA